MGRVALEDVEKYGGQGGGGFFFLGDNGDTARVRFAYRDATDVNPVAVHPVDLGGKKRYVNCLRSYNEPKEVCPLCAAGRPVNVKLFIPVYVEAEDRLLIWERGKQFIPKISGICSRYANGNKPLVSNVFEIVRKGKAKDTNTTYEIYRITKDEDPDIDENITLEDIPEVQDPIGTIVLDKSAQDLEYFLQEGQFPPEDGEEDIAPRRSSSDVGRRTPARSREVF